MKKLLKKLGLDFISPSAAIFVLFILGFILITCVLILRHIFK